MLIFGGLPKQSLVKYCCYGKKRIEYTNGEIVVVWQPHLCIHSGVCVRMLPEVYNPQERPWVKLENATTDRIVAQVEKCPSGALSYRKA